MKYKKLIVLFLMTVLLVVIYLCIPQEVNDKTQKGKKEAPKTYKKEELSDSRGTEEICISDIKFIRVSEKEIDITWSDQKNPYVDTYYLMRRKPNEDEWKQVGQLQSDHNIQDRELILTDILEEDTVQQYEYRIDVSVTDTKKYKPVEGNSIYASNLLVCIDPGHFSGKNKIVDEDGSSYSEGDATLILAKNLEEKLRLNYGVTCILTRTTGDITLGGYTNDNLDEGHISLRGSYAQGSDLFLSLHTNANQDNANEYATDEQPVSINKTLLFVNKVAYEDKQMLYLANAIGSYLTEVNYDMQISESDEFQSIEAKEEAKSWSDEYNDQLNVPGTVCVRWGEHGDYYGVLRGAAMVNVPGLIIEHGFHTIPEVRKLALKGKLLEKWAEADANGIAEGYELMKKEGD